MDNCPVKVCGQKDLKDDGKRDLDKEIASYLDKNYHKWRNPETTHMVPPLFESKKANPDIGERTEKEFYNLLQEFGETKREPMFVIHSYRFSEYIHEWESGTKCLPKWVLGEHDFVVLHRQHGVLFFQVKGSAMIYPNVLKKADEQIFKDKISLMTFSERMLDLKKLSKKKVGKPFSNFPGFVVFPNSERNHLVQERDDVICKENCSSLEAFSDWWENFVANADHPEIDETIFSLLVIRFVGMVHVSPLVGTCVEKSERALIFKTTEQVKILAGNYPPKLWIRGPAGSGKTFLLLEKVETVASDIISRQVDEKILVLCFNSALRKALETKLNDRLVERFPTSGDVGSILDVQTYTKLIVDAAGLPEAPQSNWQKAQAVRKALDELKQKTSHFCGKYDHIFVDEGQDLYEASMWPELLREMHKSLVNEDSEQGVPKSGFFWVMYDSNQYLYFDRENLKSHNDDLSNSAGLNKVLRNTGNVFKQSEKYFKSLMSEEGSVTLGHQVDGLRINWDDSLAREGAHAIVRHVKVLQSGKVKARDICILVQNWEAQMDIRRTLEYNHGIKTQDAEGFVTKTDDFIVVESIRRFKGLESKVVILYDPPFEEKPGNRVKELLYTAVSRCVCYLIVITTQDGCKALKSNQGIQEKNVSASRQTPSCSQSSSGLETQRRPQMASSNLASQRSQMTAFSKDPFGVLSTTPSYQTDSAVPYGKRPNEEGCGSFSREDCQWDQNQDHQLYRPSEKQARNSKPFPMDVDEE